MVKKANSGYLSLFQPITRLRMLARQQGLRLMEEEYFLIWTRMENRWGHCGFGLKTNKYLD